jgi:hypothetical protein
MLRRSLDAAGDLDDRRDGLGILVPAPVSGGNDLVIREICAVQRGPPRGGAVVSSLAVRPGRSRRLVGHGAS